jgi:hypothetical protein
MHAEHSPADLPAYSLDVQAMDLGPGVKAVGLELIETESREPLRGSQASAIWAPALIALAAKETYIVDFFSHLNLVRQFCASHGIAIREAASRCLVIPKPSAELLRMLLERFEAETFGLRIGPAAANADEELEKDLSRRGLDAYQPAYSRYTCCAVCEPADGWVTLLSDTLWPSEIIRRLRPSLQPFDVYIARPQ